MLYKDKELNQIVSAYYVSGEWWLHWLLRKPNSDARRRLSTPRGRVIVVLSQPIPAGGWYPPTTVAPLRRTRTSSSRLDTLSLHLTRPHTHTMSDSQPPQQPTQEAAAGPSSGAEAPAESPKDVALRNYKRALKSHEDLSGGLKRRE